MSPGEAQIKNINQYNTHMTKSMIDKLYFVDKVDAEVFVDFGCADGALLKTIQNLFPNHIYIGYDICEEMIQEAKNNNPNNIQFYGDWNEVIDQLNKYDKKKCLILSSVIHEIYSYSSKNQINDFWNQVWSNCFDYIAIRDMMVNSSTSRPSDPISVARVKQVFQNKLLQEWEHQWGSINENWSLVHFLLTYRYTENWSREVKENYLPINLEEFLNLIPREYIPSHIEHYTLPFIRKQVFKDFGIQLQDRTHLKLILEQS